MTEWAIEHNSVWHICADGKQLGYCDSEKDARLLLDSILEVERSKESTE